ncbi:hypothetical protein D3C72_1301170 [compost metagenome]
MPISLWLLSLQSLNASWWQFWQEAELSHSLGWVVGALVGSLRGASSRSQLAR